MSNYGWKNNGINVKTLIGSIESVSGAGPINTTDLITEVTTTGTDALTLANGSSFGQLKVIKAIDASSGTGTVTPTSLLDGTTIAFDNTDYAVLYWNGSAWCVISANATVGA